MADLLASQYNSVFSDQRYETNNPEDIFKENDRRRCIRDINFSEADFIEAINELASNSSSGPDEFPAMLLKKCSESLATPLFKIWRSSLDSGTVPDVCKFAHIIPIHKGKSRALAKNYRPIALTSLIVKIFEKILRKHIVKFMDDENLFNPSQHGFRSGRSCLSQLIEHL